MSSDSPPLVSTPLVVPPPFVVPDLLAFALRRAMVAVTLDLQEAVGADGVKAGQFAVLELLGQRPGARPSQIGTALGMRRNYLLPLVSELQDRGWLERRPERDRRALALFLTAPGTELLRRCRDVFAAHEARMGARLGPDGRPQLMRLLVLLGVAGSEKSGDASG